VIKPSDITSEIVTLLRAIPALVEAMGDDDERIYVYDDTYPVNVNRSDAIRNAPSPSVMVMYRSTGEAVAGGMWTHRVSLYLRPKDGGSYSDLAYLIFSGVPTGHGYAFPNCEVHQDLADMRIEGEATPTVDDEGVEYMEVNLRFEEK
jgi:hypothetical protein